MNSASPEAKQKQKQKLKAIVKLNAMVNANVKLRLKLKQIESPLKSVGSSRRLKILPSPKLERSFALTEL